MPHRANGSYVSNADALTAWTPIARDALLATAHRYHATLSGDELAAAVQQESGIIHDQPASAWIGKLLDRVAAEAQRRDEPPLAALCVPDADDEQKAQQRLVCYRAYADDLPDDGGVARRVAPHGIRPTARRETRPRTTPSRARDAPTPRLRETTCPHCFLIVPAGPVCSSCGGALPGLEPVRS
jgi:hypothetical protein